IGGNRRPPGPSAFEGKHARVGDLGLALPAPGAPNSWKRNKGSAGAGSRGPTPWRGARRGSSGATAACRACGWRGSFWPLPDPLGEEASGLFPQVTVHITRRLQAHGLLGYSLGVSDRHGPDGLLDLRDAVGRDAELA